MIEMNLALAAAVVAMSVASAMVVLALLMGIGSARRSADKGRGVASDSAVALFSGRTLVDATDAAQALLAEAPDAPTDLDRLLRIASGHVRGLEAGLARLPAEGHLEIAGMGPSAWHIVADQLGAMTRIEIRQPADDLAANAHGLAERRAAAEELALLRDMTASAPVLIWRTDADGMLTWANRAYLAAASAHLGVPERDLVWPLPMLLGPVARTAGGPTRRLAVISGNPSGQNWYECSSVGTETGTIHFAVPADATVRAEQNLRDFVQTLTKTFAHLPSGLAIFDRDRRLSLFNPALIELTQLGPDFLAARPTLHSVLDRLREARMIPERKDFPSWRSAMADLESRASAGLYEETWTLPSGQTYRVSGRPHPDGAVAFIIDDISAETALTRRFRTELELGQCALDAISAPIAVFSDAGILMMSNAAFVGFCGIDPDATLGRVNVWDVAREWERRSQGAVRAADIVDFVTNVFGEPPDAPTERNPAWPLHLARLPGGMSLVSHHRAGGETLPIRKVRRRGRLAAEQAAFAS